MCLSISSVLKQKALNKLYKTVLFVFVFFWFFDSLFYMCFLLMFVVVFFFFSFMLLIVIRVNRIRVDLTLISLPKHGVLMQFTLSTN